MPESCLIYWGNSISHLLGPDDVIPCTTKRAPLAIDLAHLLLRDLAPGGVLSAVKAAPRFQSFSRGGVGDGLVMRVSSARGGSPRPFDKIQRKQSAPGFVPFTRSLRKMTDRDRSPPCVRPGFAARIATRYQGITVIPYYLCEFPFVGCPPSSWSCARSLRGTGLVRRCLRLSNTYGCLHQRSIDALAADPKPGIDNVGVCKLTPTLYLSSKAD